MAHSGERPVRIEAIITENAERFREGVGRVYEDVWKTDHDQTEAFLSTMFERHVHCPDFAGLVALSAGQVVGFTYGYRTEPGGWWHELVKPTLVANGNGDWLTDAFEFVELAVASAFHGQGIGGRLHDQLLRVRSESFALLSTQEGESPAQIMYAKRGWVSLAEGFQYLPGGEPCSLLGLDLAAFQKQLVGR